MIERTIILLIAEDCNLRCRYCYEGHKRKLFMTSALAKEICCKELRNSEHKGENLKIVFLGGEPMLNFQVIQEVAEWAWKLDTTIPFKLFVRTNGTIMNAVERSWFAKNKHRITLSLSIDGIPFSQMINRGIDDGIIDINYFVKNWPNEKVKCVLFNETVQYLFKTIMYFVSRGIRFEIVIGDGFYWSSNAATCLERELIKISMLYPVGRVEDVDAIFSMKVEGFYPEAPVNTMPICIKDTSVACYDAAGEEYACHLLAPISQGVKNAKTLRQLSTSTELPVDEHCADCPIRFQCHNCIGMNQKITGSIFKWAAPTTTCLAYRALARACAQRYLQQIQQRARITADEYSSVTRCVRLLKEIQMPNVGQQSCEMGKQ